MSGERTGSASDVTQHEFVSGQRLFDRYTLVKVLGRGGMGIVWLAHDEELERNVALKFLPDLIIQDAAVLSDLKRDTNRCLELTHKNIVRIYDFVHDERSGCISMEYVDGDTLSSLRCDKIYLDVIERRFTDAFQAFEKEVANDDRGHLQRFAGRPAPRVLAGQPEAAKSSGEEALPSLEARFRERPDDTFVITELSWVYLALGRNADALRLSRQAADSRPIEKDALAGPIFQNGLAQIEARAGAPEEAIKILRRLLSIPAGQVVSIALLKIDPVWDPIRNRPDFQQLLSGPEQIGPNN